MTAETCAFCDKTNQHTTYYKLHGTGERKGKRESETIVGIEFCHTDDFYWQYDSTLENVGHPTPVKNAPISANIQ